MEEACSQNIENIDIHEAETQEIPLKIEKIRKSSRERHEKRRKIRSLVKKREKPAKIEEISTKKPTDKRVIFLSVACLLTALILYQLKYGSCEFWAAYNKNFNRIVYGDENYCFREIDTTRIAEKLRAEVINQDEVISLIEGSLKLANQHGMIQMALHGTTGVGKSLSSDVITSSLLWRRNAQKFIYGSFNQDNILQDASSRLSKCGFNLIIIDDLDVSDKAVEFVKQFEDDLRLLAKREEYRVILVIIFKELIEEEEQKRSLANFVMIEFKSFTRTALIDCIELHRKRFNVPISKSEMEELIELNYTSSGCKQVAKRLNLVSHMYK